MFAREDLFYMDRTAIDYALFVHEEIAEAFYQSSPYFVAAIAIGGSMYTMSCIDVALFLSSILSIVALGYFGYMMISELDTCLEKAKNERLALLAKIETLEKEKESMKTVFKQMMGSISEDEIKKVI
uniref:Uncharacterized protein n=1 Tax=viral metagenome TaxID=1070528 RepID=A0A6C0E0N9_9ZZZZ